MTTIRLPQDANICVAPGYIAEDLLRAEGFTEIRYVASTSDDPVARSEVDFDMVSGVALIAYLDAGQPLTALAGIHSGCYELFARDPIQTVSDLKGKRIAIRGLNYPGHFFVAIMAAQVGLDPQTDIEWVTSSEVNPMELFADGKADAFLASRPSRRSCAIAGSGAWSSTRRRTGLGRSTSAASSMATGSGSGLIRSPPSAFCGLP